MESLFVAFAVLLLVIFFLGLGVWIFAALLLVSTLGLALLIDMDAFRIGTIMAPLVIRSATGWELSAIPMFIWMGEIMLRTDISDRLFRGLSPLTYYLPGRLLHTTIIGSALFAAVSGSSAATTATVGKITIPELDRRNYSHELSIGSLAGAGSLGLLIPPSIVMIVYGVLAEVSISRLFAAGVVPGLMLAAFYSGYVALVSLLRPGAAPTDDAAPTFRTLAGGVLDLLPIGVLIFIVLGAIYSGIATPSEAAAVGVVATILLTLAMRQLSWSVLVRSLTSAVHTSCMIAMILVTAAFLSTAMGFLHVPQDVATAITALDLSPAGLILVLSLFYVVLGMFLEGVSMTVMSLPITAPARSLRRIRPDLVRRLPRGHDRDGADHPADRVQPVHPAEFDGHPITRVARAAAPFFGIMCLAVVVLTAFPGIALWLPNALFGP